MDKLIDLVIKYCPPPYAWGIIIALFLIWITYKATSFFNRTKEVCQEFPKIKDDLNNIKTDIADIKGKISTISTIIFDKDINTTSTFAVSNSPRVLSEVGKKLFKDSGAEQIMKKEVASLVKELEGKSIESALGLEKESFILLASKIGNPEFKEISKFVYQHPVYGKNPLTISDIIFVMAITLRDEYLKKHNELKDN